MPKNDNYSSQIMSKDRLFIPEKESVRSFYFSKSIALNHERNAMREITSAFFENKQQNLKSNEKPPKSTKQLKNTP